MTRHSGSVQLECVEFNLGASSNSRHCIRHLGIPASGSTHHVGLVQIPCEWPQFPHRRRGGGAVRKAALVRGMVRLLSVQSDQMDDGPCDWSSHVTEWTCGGRHSTDEREMIADPSQQRSAHENPVIFYSLAIGFCGRSLSSCPGTPLSFLTPEPAVHSPPSISTALQVSENLRSSHLRAGPAMVLGVPPLRKSFGWKPAERIPTTFPRESIADRLWK